MKNIALTLLILAGTIASTFNACKKPGSIPNYPVNDSLKAAFNFQPGTYWIYRDSISGEVDSFYVQTNYTNNNNNVSYTYDVIRIHIVAYYNSPSSYADWDYYYAGNEIDMDYGGSNMQTCYYAPFINYPFQNSITLFRYSSSYFVTDSALVKKIYSTYTVNGNAFTDVAEVNHSLDTSGTGLLDYNDVFYMCPAVGMIKMRLNHPKDSINRVWEILRWGIVK